MYQPSFNSVLVEIDDSTAKWGNGNDDSMLGKSYSKGVVKAYGELLPTAEHPVPPNMEHLPSLITDVMWNEGHEAGTLFEDDGKQYAFIYWWDLRGARE
jgi:hypothetical protein